MDRAGTVDYDCIKNIAMKARALLAAYVEQLEESEAERLLTRLRKSNKRTRTYFERAERAMVDVCTLLPHHLLVYMLSHCAPHNTLNMMLVCKLFHGVVHSEPYWRRAIAQRLHRLLVVPKLASPYIVNMINFWQPLPPAMAAANIAPLSLKKRVRWLMPGREYLIIVGVRSLTLGKIKWTWWPDKRDDDTPPLEWHYMAREAGAWDGIIWLGLEPGAHLMVKRGENGIPSWPDNVLDMWDERSGRRWCGPSVVNGARTTFDPIWERGVYY